MTQPDTDFFNDSYTRFPAIQPKRDLVSGKGLDDVYTKNNERLLQLIDENKRTQTENNSLKVVNEKLNDRIDFLQSIIEKEASANTYYYNYPPKPDESLK